MTKFRYLVEPCFLLYYSALLLQVPTIQQYVYSWYSKEYGLKYHYGSQSSSCNNGEYNKTEMDLQKHVQSKAASFNAGFVFCQSIPCMVTLLFYGSISDVIGRKPVLVLTTAMTTVYMIITTVTVLFSLNLKYIYIGAILDGLGGSYPGLVMTGTTYLADVTEKDKLPIRFAIFESALLVSLASFYFSSGLLITKYSFKTLESLITILTCLSFLWALFVLKESLNFNNPNAQKMEFSFKSTLSAPKKLLASWKRQYHQRCSLYLSIGALSLSNVITAPVFNLILLFLLNSPFCFSAISNGYYLGTLFVTLSIGSAIGVKVGLRFLPSPAVALISCFCGSAYYFLLGNSTNEKMLYAGLVLKSFSLLHVPLFRSIISNMIIVSDRGSIFSIMACFDQFLSLIFVMLFSFLYSHINNAGHPGYFFFITGSLFIIPSSLIISYWIMTSRKAEDKETLVVN